MADRRGAAGYLARLTIAPSCFGAPAAVDTVLETAQYTLVASTAKLTTSRSASDRRVLGVPRPPAGRPSTHRHRSHLEAYVHVGVVHGEGEARAERFVRSSRDGGGEQLF